MNQRRTRDRKVASSSPGRNGMEIFISSDLSVLTLIRYPFHPRVTAVTSKTPRSFCQKRTRQLHLNTHTPLTQRGRSGLTRPLSRYSVGTLSGNELTRNVSGNIQPQSSQLAESVWTDPGVKSGWLVGALSPVNYKGLHQG